MSIQGDIQRNIFPHGASSENNNVLYQFFAVLQASERHTNDTRALVYTDLE